MGDEGWSGHPVCQKRYHFIIPREKNNNTRYPLPEQHHTPTVCKACGCMLHLSDFTR